MSALPLPWLPASFPPASDPNPASGLSIECIGVVISEDGRHGEIVSWWPLRRVWTATRLSAEGEPYDAVVTVSHYFEIPELPALEAA